MKHERVGRGVHRTVRWPVLAAALSITIVLAPTQIWSHDHGHRIRVDVPWPIILPDGSTHEAGPLRLCLQRMWTPTSGLHEFGKPPDSTAQRASVPLLADENTDVLVAALLR